MGPLRWEGGRLDGAVVCRLNVRRSWAPFVRLMEVEDILRDGGGGRHGGSPVVGIKIEEVRRCRSSALEAGTSADVFEQPTWRCEGPMSVVERWRCLCVMSRSNKCGDGWGGFNVLK